MRRLPLFLPLVLACGQNAPPSPVTVPIAASASPSASIDADCGVESDYVAQSDSSGKPPSLPPLPTLSTAPIKTGDAYTVFGAAHLLRSVSHRTDVTANPISIVAHIVDSNIPRAPACAIHRTGKADPPGCDIEVPSFWIADEKGNASDPKIRVIGWARNFAIIFDAMAAYKKLKPGTVPKSPFIDDVLNVDVPFPLPAVGMKVKLTGRYDFARAFSADVVREPIAGVMALTTMELLEPAPAPASFAKP